MADEPTLIPPQPGDPNPDTEGLAAPPEANQLPTVVVDSAPPPPLGRSWAFDHGTELFIRSRGVVLETRGIETLLGWVDKCLHTARGALEIHPPEFGLVEPDRIFGRPIAELSAQELEEKFRDALTFHPRIADVTNLQLHTDDETGRAFATYIIVQDPPTQGADVLTARTSLGAV